MQYSYPWYDSIWLRKYVLVKDFIEQNHPHKYVEFVDAFQPLRTRPDFKIVKINNIFNEQIIRECKEVITNLKSQDEEKHELSSFGRLVVHNHYYFNQLQKSLTPLVSEAVEEPVEPCYNFLSLYNAQGSCKVHMDAPEAKWTLDCCIEQSEPWSIHFSQIQSWPEVNKYQGQNWEQEIKTDSDNVFTSYSLQEKEALIFSGSSQWHYRDKITHATNKTFCHLVFFHYIPQGMKEIVKPENWSNLFNIPDLKTIEFWQTNFN